MTFKYVDLFAGIGGFHAALAALGGECVSAVEIDKFAARIYEQNWGMSAHADITDLANDKEVLIPDHDVLAAGFPCQPFSKSGAQRGMDETRGTLYFNILQIIEKRRPALVILENVRNLAGPRHIHEWNVIIRTLREQGYKVADQASIFSPHLIPREFGGRPQVRERVFIVAVRKDALDPKELILEEPLVRPIPSTGWNPDDWNLVQDLPLDNTVISKTVELSAAEKFCLDAWNEFVVDMWELREGKRLPGHPLWGDDWRTVDEAEFLINELTPRWKADFLRKNALFYEQHKGYIDEWIKRWDFFGDNFTPSRRKLEWQAQDTPSLWETVMHFRPSGIRAKRATYLPALVAITQTSVLGSQGRRLSPREAARLQGLPEWFSFDGQTDALTYKQLGNGVSIGAIWYVLKKAAEAFRTELEIVCPDLLSAITSAPENPDLLLENLRDK